MAHQEYFASSRTNTGRTALFHGIRRVRAGGADPPRRGMSAVFWKRHDQHNEIRTLDIPAPLHR